MVNLLRKAFAPYEKPEGEQNVFAIINTAAVEGRKLTEEEWRQMLLATYIRLENHERICKIRGGIMIVGLFVVILRLFDEKAWAVITALGQIL